MAEAKFGGFQFPTSKTKQWRRNAEEKVDAPHRPLIRPRRADRMHERPVLIPQEQDVVPRVPDELRGDAHTTQQEQLEAIEVQ